MKPALRSTSPATRAGMGPSLLGLAGALWVVTRIIVWLPLGFVGSFINGLIWPVILLSLVIGGVLTFRRFAR